jgi:hypothetical protein
MIEIVHQGDVSEQCGYCRAKGHPERLAVGESVIEPMFNTKNSDRSDVDNI